MDENLALLQFLKGQGLALDDEGFFLHPVTRGNDEVGYVYALGSETSAGRLLAFYVAFDQSQFASVKDRRPQKMVNEIYEYLTRLILIDDGELGETIVLGAIEVQRIELHCAYAQTADRIFDLLMKIPPLVTAMVELEHVADQFNKA